MPINAGMMTSNTPEWGTPQWLFDELDAEFHFNLDPCCTHENAKCAKHFTKEEDGLNQEWGWVPRLLQSTLRQRDREMGKEGTRQSMLDGDAPARTDGYIVVSRLHLSQS